MGTRLSPEILAGGAVGIRWFSRILFHFHDGGGFFLLRIKWDGQVVVKCGIKVILVMIDVLKV